MAQQAREWYPVTAVVVLEKPKVRDGWYSIASRLRNADRVRTQLAAIVTTAAGNREAVDVPAR
jgi:hypothetical protein